jgi:hypothetical protein
VELRVERLRLDALRLRLVRLDPFRLDALLLRPFLLDELRLVPLRLDALREDDLREDDLRLGTFAPDLRASESPMAIACLRLLTVLLARPLFSLPRLYLCIALPTFFCAVLLYFAMVAPFMRSTDNR